MFDLFRSREKTVRIMLGGLLLVVAVSMLTYLIPNYNTGGPTGREMIIAEIGGDTITLPEVQKIVQMTMRSRQLPAGASQGMTFSNDRFDVRSMT